MATPVQTLVDTMLTISHEHTVQLHIEADELNEFIERIYARYKVNKLTLSYNPNIDAFTVVAELWY